MGIKMEGARQPVRGHQTQPGERFVAELSAEDSADKPIKVTPTPKTQLPSIETLDQDFRILSITRAILSLSCGIGANNDQSIHYPHHVHYRSRAHL